MDGAAGRKPILIVEDDQETRYALARMLEIRGYDTVEVGTGAGALRYLLPGKPACLIILDMKLPDMSGDDLRAALRHRPDLAAIPVIVFSGVAQDRETEGIAAYIRKAGDPEDLLAAVEKACGKGRT